MAKSIEEENEEVEFTIEEQSIKSQRPNRPVWGRRLEFILAAVGYAVGFGNIWRFPWLLMKNGGGAFLIPYGIMLLLEGIPLFILELAIGQRHHLAPIPLWRKVSTFSSGIGVAQFLRVFFGEALYFSILGWSMYYFFASFQGTLPWSSCDSMDSNALIKGSNQTLCSKVGPTVYYWYEEALQLSDGIGNDLKINWKILLCLIATGVIITLSLIKGIRSAGKVVYFTTIFPYIVLLIFLIRGLTLTGAEDGLKYLFTFDFSRLRDPYVWLQASSQIFYSLSLASGGMVTYASYNPTRQDIFVDAITISTINALTSLTAGLAVFSLLGHRAYLFTEKCKDKRANIMTEIFQIVNATLNDNYNGTSMSAIKYRDIKTEVLKNVTRTFDVPVCDINKVLEDSPSGSGLAFITLTEVINQLPAATFFSIMFFLMLITVGLDSTFGTLEGAIGSILDMKRFHNYRQELVTVVYLGIVTLGALPFSTNSGEYILQLFNTYGIDMPAITLAFMEIVAVMYFYGTQRFCDDIKMMTGRTVHGFLKILFRFVSPLILLTLFIATVVDFAKSGVGKYQRWDSSKGEVVKEYYPPGAAAFGWFILLILFAGLPIVPLYTLFTKRKKGTHHISEEVVN